MRCDAAQPSDGMEPVLPGFSAQAPVRGASHRVRHEPRRLALPSIPIVVVSLPVSFPVVLAEVTAAYCNLQSRLSGSLPVGATARSRVLGFRLISIRALMGQPRSASSSGRPGWTGAERDCHRDLSRGCHWQYGPGNALHSTAAGGAPAYWQWGLGSALHCSASALRLRLAAARGPVHWQRGRAGGPPVGSHVQYCDPRGRAPAAQPGPGGCPGE